MKENKSKKSIKKSAIIGSSVSLAYLIIGDISYKLSLSRKGLNSKLINNISAKKKSKKPVDEYKNSLDRIIDEEAKWFDEQKREKIEIEEKKQKNLHADFFPSKVGSDIFVICIHGYTSSPEKMGVYAHKYYDEGYNVLLPSLRGHGDSEEEFITMGWNDRLDVIQWINYIVKKHPDSNIILHGVSMGAATVMMVTGEKLPDNVKVAIEDCGYTTAWDILGLKLEKNIKLPKFPFLFSANIINIMKEKFNLRNASSVKQVKKSITPTLFIHGEKDTFVPYDMLEKVYDAANCQKEKLSVPDAPHARSVCAHPDLYWKAIFDFIKKYL